MATTIRVSIALAVAILVATVVSFSLPTQAQQTEDATPIPSDELFKGRIVVLRIDQSSALETKESSRAVTQVSIQEIGGRYFVTGLAYVSDHPEFSSQAYLKGVSVGIAWERVSEFQAYTEDQYNAYIQAWKEIRED